VMLAELAARVPIYTVMSGPAGGIMGATKIARGLDAPGCCHSTTAVRVSIAAVIRERRTS